ncbi:MAG: extracellular solute-binding protein [Anaerolineae bacterium]
MLKRVSLLLLVVLALSFTLPVAAQASGCPEGLWTMMSAELTSACKGELAGTSVTMTGPFVDVDEAKFNDAIKEFEGWTGIDIKYTGSKEFEAAIRAAVDAGAAPDIVDFPQPGLLKDIVQKGAVTDISTFMDPEWLKTNYKQGWLDMAQIAGADGKTIMAGVWNRNNGKSVVWYPKAAWEAAGYKSPQHGKN